METIVEFTELNDQLLSVVENMEFSCLIEHLERRYKLPTSHQAAQSFI